MPCALTSQLAVKVQPDGTTSSTLYVPGSKLDAIVISPFARSESGSGMSVIGDLVSVKSKVSPPLPPTTILVILIEPLLATCLVFVTVQVVV